VEHASDQGLHGGIGAQSSLRETIRSFEYESPKSRGHARDGTVIEGEVWLAPSKKDSGKLAVGNRIFHQKFGYGKVVSADGNKLEVAFEKAGTKKIIDSFVEPT
jgi:DNA helicase-2/ATP-dependent DNA helicase PcrA